MVNGYQECKANLAQNLEGEGNAITTSTFRRDDKTEQINILKVQLLSGFYGLIF